MIIIFFELLITNYGKRIMAPTKYHNQERYQFNCFQSRSVITSSYSKYIVSSGVDDYLSLWNIANPKRNLTLDGHTKKITSVAFSPNAHIIASASYDNSVRLWFPGSSIKTKILKGHTAPVRSVDFFSDGRTILTAGDDKTVKLWDT